MSIHGLPSEIRTVLVDLDDTLYPQQSWLDGAWRRVALAARGANINPLHFEHELRSIAAEGSDKGRIIDRALASVGRSDLDVRPLVAAFLTYRPETLTPYPGAREALADLARAHRVVVVTDGVSEIQRHKIAVLGLERFVHDIVVSDELGREFRKPSPEPLKLAIARARSHATDTVMIGDRPNKDVLAARQARVACIRVRTGEYAAMPDEPLAELVVDDFATAARLLLASDQRRPIDDRR